jgi:hypothetical protein
MVGRRGSDPELKQDDQNGPHDFVWVSNVWITNEWQVSRPLWWRLGRIYTKHPDRAMIGKMLEIAARLAAKVQGDDDEVYPSLDHWPA